jgi:hypothetical protein
MGGVELAADRLRRRAVVPGDALRLLEQGLEVVRGQRPAGVFLLQGSNLEPDRGGPLPSSTYVGADRRQVRARVELTAGPRNAPARRSAGSLLERRPASLKYAV